MIVEARNRRFYSRLLSAAGAVLAAALILVGASACHVGDAPPNPTLVDVFDIESSTDGILDVAVTEDASHAAFITDCGGFALDLKTGEQVEIPISDYIEELEDENGNAVGIASTASFVPFDNERVIIMQDEHPVRIYNYEDESLVTPKVLEEMNVTECWPTKDGSKLRCFVSGDLDVNASGDIYISELPRMVVCSADGEELIADVSLPFELGKEELSFFQISDDCTRGYLIHFSYETDESSLVTIDLRTGETLSKRPYEGQFGHENIICELDNGQLLLSNYDGTDVWRYDCDKNEVTPVGASDGVAVVNSEYYDNNDYMNIHESRETTLMITSQRYNSVFENDGEPGLYDALDFSNPLDNSAVVDDVEIAAYDNMTGEKLWSAPCRARVLYDLLFANQGALDISTSEATSDGRYLYIAGFVNGYDLTDPSDPFHNVAMASRGMVVLDTKTGELIEHDIINYYGDDSNDPEYEIVDATSDGRMVVRSVHYLILADNDKTLIAVDKSTGRVGVYDTNIGSSSMSLMEGLTLEAAWPVIVLVTVVLLVSITTVIVAIILRRRHRRKSNPRPRNSNLASNGTKHCPWCGYHLDGRGGYFCPHCGKRFDDLKFEGMFPTDGPMD